MRVEFGTDDKKHIYTAIVKGIPSESKRRKPTVLFDIHPFLDDGTREDGHVFSNITVKQAKALRNALKKAIRKVQ